MAADFRIASEHARFGEVWIKLGCVPALGGMYLLPRIIGLAKATELILTGELIDAKEALRIGLNRGLESNLWAELESTVEAQLQCFATKDFTSSPLPLTLPSPPRGGEDEGEGGEDQGEGACYLAR